MRALDRDDVSRLLDDTDRRLVPAGVGADAAKRALGEVEAALTEPDFLLDLDDCRGKGPCLLLGSAKNVEGKALGGALPDSGQPRELRHQAGKGRWAFCAHDTPSSLAPSTGIGPYRLPPRSFWPRQTSPLASKRPTGNRWRGGP